MLALAVDPKIPDPAGLEPKRFAPPVCVFPKMPPPVVFGCCCCCCCGGCCCWVFVFDPNRPPPVGLLVGPPNRPVVVPVFVEVFPPPNNEVGLLCVCCVALPNKLPVAFVFGWVLPKIEVLPLGLAALAFVVFPKSEVPGAVVVLVLAEEVPKIDDVPAVFALLVLPKSEDPVAGWFDVFAPPKPPPPKIPPPEVPPPVFWF